MNEEKLYKRIWDFEVGDYFMWDGELCVLVAIQTNKKGYIINYVIYNLDSVNIEYADEEDYYR